MFSDGGIIRGDFWGVDLNPHPAYNSKYKKR